MPAYLTKEIMLLEGTHYKQMFFLNKQARSYPVRFACPHALLHGLVLHIYPCV